MDEPRHREVGVKGLARIKLDESMLQEARRRILDRHHVSEAYAKWAARRYGRYLVEAGLRELAQERELLVTVAEGPFHVKREHLELFVALVRAETEHSTFRPGFREPAPPRVKRVWRSLEEQRREASEQ